MSKRREHKQITNIKYDNYDSTLIIIPTVIYNSEPKIKIWDHKNDGTYWYSEIGFNRKITDN